MSKLQNTKDKILGKTKEVIAEINGDINLKREGEAQAAKGARRAETEKRETGFGKLNDLT